jgi:hypothetical protein
MKKSLFAFFFVLAATIVCPTSLPAQMGGSNYGLKFDSATRKLFGDNQEFKTDIEVTVSSASSKNDTMSITSHMAVSDGKCRFEFSVADIKGAQMPADAVAQMKAMGMDRTVMISKDSGKHLLMIYPGLSSYVEMSPMQAVGEDEKKTGKVDDFKVDITAIGAETIEGHACTKNKVVVTDANGGRHESTVWNAKDLHNFPIQIKTVEQGNSVTMRFRNISFTKPDASIFVVPAGYTGYPSMQAMFQQVMMKRMSQMQNAAGEE